MSEYYIHITAENERWDSLASKYYGNCYEISGIISENPHIPISEVLETGIQVKIPVLEEVITDEPNWK